MTRYVVNVSDDDVAELRRIAERDYDGMLHQALAELTPRVVWEVSDDDR